MIICDDIRDFEMWKYFMHGILVKCDEQWDCLKDCPNENYP